jgi:hypothetical protein
MEYTVLTGDSLDQLVRKVVEWIAAGWTPQGGVALADLHGAYYIQAMIRK